MQIKRKSGPARYATYGIVFLIVARSFGAPWPINAIAGVILLVGAAVVIYQETTPLFAIRHGQFISWGLFPWDKRTLPIAEVSSVRLGHELSFMSAFLPLTLESKTKTVRVWVHASDKPRLSEIRKLLEHGFGGRLAQADV